MCSNLLKIYNHFEKCGKVIVKVEESVLAVTCHICCVKMGPPLTPAVKTQTGPKRPKGWRFMKQFVDADGTVFQLKEIKGEDGKTRKESVEVPELKGTLPPTVIVPKPKKSTFEREKEKAAKEAKLAKKFEKKQEKAKQEEEQVKAAKTAV